MPVQRLSRNPHRVVPATTLGSYESASSRFVNHVAVAINVRDILAAYGEVLAAAHMRPPCVPNGVARAHLAANVPLGAAEVSKILTWISKLELDGMSPEVLRARYIINPPLENKVTISNKRVRHIRFNCIGFVLLAFSKVGLQLLVSDDANLPPVTAGMLYQFYPRAKYLKPTSLEKLGLHNHTGPWQIILPGYVMHSLDRPEADIRSNPYSPRAGDELF